MDFRRILPKERVNQNFGSADTNFFLHIQKVDSKMTIKNIDVFIDEFLFPTMDYLDYCPIAHVSNVGPMRFTSPLKDFYIQCTSNEIGLRPWFQVPSYSKVNKESNMNDIVLNMRCSPLMVSNKVANDIFETYAYFLKNVDASKKSGDVLDELIHFQKSLEKNIMYINKLDIYVKIFCILRIL